MGLESWSAAVDREVRRRTGLGLDEMVGDWPSADLWEEGYSAAEAAEYVLENLEDLM